MTRKTKNQSGFTLVELMIATAVFSVILLLITTAVIQIGRLFYKGISTSRAQSANREVLDDVSRSLQLSGAAVQEGSNASMAPPALIRSLCIGSTQYTYVEGYQSDKNVSFSAGSRKIRHVMWRDEEAHSSCAPKDLREVDPDNTVYAAPVAPYTCTNCDGREMIPNGMRLKYFHPYPDGVALGSLNAKYWLVAIGILNGDTDLIDGGTGNCISTNAGGAFCGVSELTTAVNRRVQ